MINYRAGILDKYLGLRDISALYQGRIIEHIVGQELLCALANEDIPLRFWAREKNNHRQNWISASVTKDIWYP